SDRARPDRVVPRNLYLGAARPPAAAALERGPDHAAGRCLPPHAALHGAGRGAIDRGWRGTGVPPEGDARRRAGRAPTLRGDPQAACDAPAGGERQQPHALPLGRWRRPAGARPDDGNLGRSLHRQHRLALPSRRRSYLAAPRFALCCDPLRCCQRCARPVDQLVRLVHQPLRRAPEGEVDGAALLAVVERRGVAGFRESRPVLVVDAEVERVVGDHAQHHPVAEHAGLPEHAPHRDAAERRELIAQEFGEVVAGDHGLILAHDRLCWERGTPVPLFFCVSVSACRPKGGTHADTFRISIHRRLSSLSLIGWQTACRCNRQLGRSGPFWQADYWDRFIRNDAHFEAAIDYIDNNPVKAGLTRTPADWPWESARFMR